MKEKEKFKAIACAFATWLDPNQREMDFREERNHTMDELYDIFIHDKIVSRSLYDTLA